MREAQETSAVDELCSRLECTDSSPATGKFVLEADRVQIDRVLRGAPGGSDNVQSILPLSSLQQGMLFQHLMNPDKDRYVLSLLFEISSRVQVSAFVRAVQATIDRHEALRSAIQWNGLSCPIQIVHRRVQLPVEEIEATDDGSCKQLRRQMALQGPAFDLTRAPVMRLIYAVDGDGLCHALLQVHHIFCDFRSWELLVAETIACMGDHARDLPLPVSYVSHSLHTNARADVASAESPLREALAEVDEPTAPFGLLEMLESAGAPLDAQCCVEPDLARRIRNGAQSAGVSVARMFYAAWALVVARTSGRDDVIFGTVVSTRSSGNPHSSAVMGLFVNTLPLRLQIAGLTVAGLLEHTNLKLASLIAHRDLPLSTAQQGSGLAGNGPLFTTVINYRRSAEGFAVGAVGAGGVRLVARKGVRTNYPIAIAIDEQQEIFQITVQTDVRIDPYRILDYMTTALVALADASLHAPQTDACTLSVLPAHERERIVETFNATHANYPRGMVIQELFESQVARTPEAVAVTRGDRQLTYRELNHRANRVAHLLLGRGVRPEDRVGLCIERDLELVVGLLGIIKAGAAYVPLDSDYPVERLRYMIRDSAPVAIVANERLRSDLPAEGVPVIAIDASADALERESDSDLHPEQIGLRSNNLVSVIYTSGSTGQPKGVMVEHASLCNLAHAQRQTLEVQPDSRILQFASLSFDACTWECVMALCSGARLAMASREELAPGEPLQRLLIEREITHATLPPVALAALTPDERLQLRTLVVAGEACPPALAKKWHTGRRFINAYGPTEATVCASMHWYTPADDERLPIGRPIPNARIYILDSHRQPVPIDVAGEIYVGGEGVARGYLGKPELTEQRFVPDSFVAQPGRRMYRTGDLGYWREDGTIEFLGRNDFQVKIRGFRIELGEIESQLSRHVQVRESVVIVRETSAGDRQLVAYVSLQSNGTLSVAELRAHLKDALPVYMVPSAFVILPFLPLTPNGKVDRRALPMPSADAYARSTYESPQGVVEERVVRLWQELLQLGQVGRQDNFFELGGHSLLAIKLLLKINQEFDRALRVTDIYRYPVVRDLAACIAGIEIEEESVDLPKEAKLDDLVVACRVLPTPKAREILFTGATGFVGRFLLAQLLADTDARLWCLVRAESAGHALSRLRLTLKKWELWSDAFEARIVPLAGDVSRPRLGLDDATWNRLAASVDTIYHCAASMNHLETYAMAKPGNVGAMKELLRLAMQSSPKIVNFVSTLSVFRASGGEVGRTVGEDTSIDAERHSSLQGYAASKWVAEKMTMNAGALGIPCNIFRVGLVWADARAGRYDPFQQADMILRTCLLTGLGIERFKYQMAPTPVDGVARAIVALGERHRDGGGIFHLSSSEQLAGGVFERCNEIADVSLQILPHYEWIQHMKDLHRAGWILPALPLIDFAFGMDESAFHQYHRRKAATAIRFDCTRTDRELHGIGMSLHKLDDHLLQLYVARILCEDVELRSATDRRRSALLRSL